MKTVMDPFLDNFQEIHINIEDAHITVLTDLGINLLGTAHSSRISPLHFHSYYEVFYIRDGEMTVRCEVDNVRCKKGNLVMMPPQMPHKTVLESENSSRYCIGFHVQKNSLKTEYSLYDKMMQTLPEGRSYVCVKDGSSLEHCMKKMTEHIADCNHFRFSGFFYEFVLALMELIGTLPADSPEELLADSSMGRSYKIQRMISKHYMKDISLEYLAESLHLSTRQMNRIVQSVYGCTYREIIARTRIGAAAERLRNTDANISRIAEEVGYRSLRGFYSAFQKQYGCLPTEYRKRAKASKNNG